MISNIFQLLILWAHLISATAWVGGSLFWVLILNPSIKKTNSSHNTLLKSVSRDFKALVDSCIFILLTTGTIMTFNRITLEEIGPKYLGILTIKLMLVAYLFYLIRAKRISGLTSFTRRDENLPKYSIVTRIMGILSGYNLVVILGLTIYILSDILRLIYQGTVS